MSNQNENTNKPPQRKGGMGPGPGGHRGMPIEKAKNFKKSFRRLVKYIADKKVALIAVLILAAASSVFGIFGPKILGNATDVIVEGLTQIDQDAIYAKLSEPETIQALQEHPEAVEIMQSMQSDPESAMDIMQDEDAQESLTAVFGDLSQYRKTDIDSPCLGILAKIKSAKSSCLNVHAPGRNNNRPVSRKRGACVYTADYHGLHIPTHCIQNA